MLYALGHPVSFVVLLVSFVVGVTLHGYAQSFAAGRFRDHRPALEKRNRPNPQYQVDPFGAIGGAIAGMGWAKPVELLDRRRRTAVVVVALSGPLVNIALGVGLLAAYRALYPNGALYSDFVTRTPSYYLQHGYPGSSASLALLYVGLSQLYLGVLSLVPLPPLDGGRLLFALTPRTMGWERARYWLIEQNIGIVAVLVLLIVTLGGGQAILPHILDEILSPLVRLILGV